MSASAFEYYKVAYIEYLKQMKAYKQDLADRERTLDDLYDVLSEEEQGKLWRLCKEWEAECDI